MIRTVACNRVLYSKVADQKISSEVTSKFSTLRDSTVSLMDVTTVQFYSGIFRQKHLLLVQFPHFLFFVSLLAINTRNDSDIVHNSISGCCILEIRHVASHADRVFHFDWVAFSCL